MARISRSDYAKLYGPTTGDAVRLGDTSLLAEVEHDYAVYGEECLHGGGKTLRDGLGLTAGYDSAAGSLDMLLCNALVIDPVLGIVKGDIGIKDGRIVGIGKAGNPATMDGVHPELICGAATTVRDAEGLIATPGADAVATCEPLGTPVRKYRPSVSVTVDRPPIATVTPSRPSPSSDTRPETIQPAAKSRAKTRSLRSASTSSGVPKLDGEIEPSALIATRARLPAGTRCSEKT